MQLGLSLFLTRLNRLYHLRANLCRLLKPRGKEVFHQLYLPID